MEIDLLYIADCPNRQSARRHLHIALGRAGRTAVIRECEVGSSDEAAVLGMRGSPTILIDGLDPFTEGGAATGVSCRLYADGAAFRGAPSVDQIIEVLRRWPRQKR